MRHPKQTRARALLWAVGLVLAGGCSDEPVAAKADAGIIFGTKDALDDSLGDADEGDAATSQDIVETEPKPCETPGGWGCKCEQNDECLAGYCVESETGKVCTKICSSKCPKDWTCVQSPGAGDLTYICVPQFTNLCKPCKGHADCVQAGFDKGQNKCIPQAKSEGFTNGSFCGSPCKDATSCKAGYECKEFSFAGEAAPVKQCVPKEGADCGCIPAWVALQTSTECIKKNDFGVCKSQRTCLAEGLSLCNVVAPSAEVCDTEDNDCDGKTDEDDAVGCTVFYKDNDSDGAGLGEGDCLCQNPGPGYAKSGGDCNDLVASVKPGADEICDNVDNNCNGDTDESGAKGCKIFFKDKDGDTFGDKADSACLCPSKKTADWIEQAGDCNDQDDKIKPGVVEVCNKGVDDNCNSKTDEEGAEGCSLFYVDVDKDGYGPSDSGKCLCAENKIYAVDKPGDCDDNNAKVHPTAAEVCNGVDDDCNGTKDDGSATAGCPAVIGGKPGCNAQGKCAVGTCNKGLFDINKTVDDGCECQADNQFGLKGNLCTSAIDLGQLPDGSGSNLKAGNVMPGEAGDWFHFHATDSPDAGGACDQFHVRVKFTDNPNSQFAFDLYKDICPGQAGGTPLCAGQQEAGWSTSFYGGLPTGADKAKQTPVIANPDNKIKNGSPNPENAGECKCTAAPGLPGMNICSDNSAHFYVHVYRKKGLPESCDSYGISIINAPPK